jgi:hypothetical protein
LRYIRRLSPLQLNATATCDGTFDYYPTCLGGRPLKASDKHVLRVTFTPLDLARFSVARAKVELVVRKAASVLAWPGFDVRLFYVGTSLSAQQLCAVCTNLFGGTFDYEPACGTVMDAEGKQQLVVHYHPSAKDAANYETATMHVTLDVLPLRIPVIVWKKPEDITYGATLSMDQLNAVVPGFADDGKLEYFPEHGSLLDAGIDHELSVTFVPHDPSECVRAEATVLLTVKKATPVIEWPYPRRIYVGAALSDEQLCATCPKLEGGMFVYDPPVGTVMSTEGEHSLLVVYEPSIFRQANYTLAVVMREIDVISPEMPKTKKGIVRPRSARLQQIDRYYLNHPDSASFLPNSFRFLK